MHRVRVLENNWTQGNAIGFAVRKAGDKVYVSHGGSYPGYQTNTMLQLDGKVGVIVLTNADDGNPGAIATQLMNTVGEAVAKAAARPPATTDVGSVVVAFCRALPRPRRRVAGHRTEQAAGDHHAERRESRQPDPARADWQRAVPLCGAGGGGPVGEIVRFVEENGRVVAHVHRRRIRRARAAAAVVVSRQSWTRQPAKKLAGSKK